MIASYQAVAFPGSAIAHVFVANPLAVAVDAPMSVEMPEGFAGLILDPVLVKPHKSCGKKRGECWNTALKQ